MSTCLNVGAPFQKKLTTFLPTKYFFDASSSCFCRHEIFFCATSTRFRRHQITFCAMSHFLFQHKIIFRATRNFCFGHRLERGSEFSSYEIKLRKMTLHFELLTRRFNFYFSTFEFLTRSWKIKNHASTY